MGLGRFYGLNDECHFGVELWIRQESSPLLFYILFVILLVEYAYKNKNRFCLV